MGATLDKLGDIPELKDSVDSIKRHINSTKRYYNSGSGLSNALLGFSILFDEIIEQGLYADKKEFYKKAGDFFFTQTIDLNRKGIKKESELTLFMALEYYKSSNVDIPSDLKKNWENYAYGESNIFRTDWDISKN